MRSHARFYSRRESVRRLFRFQLVHVIIARYARQLNRLWKRRNATYLKALDLMRSPRITLDYREQVEL